MVTNLEIADRISLLLFECNITHSKLYAANSILHPLIPSAYSTFSCDWHCKNKMTKALTTSGDHTPAVLVFKLNYKSTKPSIAHRKKKFENSSKQIEKNSCPHQIKPHFKN